MLEDWGSKFI